MTRNRIIWGAVCVVASVLSGGAAVAADEPPDAVAPCLACHGDAGNNPVPGMLAPKLSGLHAQYLVKELNDFKYGRRVFEAMNGFAKDLSPADIKTVANYFAAQTRTPDEATDAALAKQGQQYVLHGIRDQAVPACVNCHNDGVTGTFRYPRLAGQKADYVVNQLTNLKSGARKNDFGQMSRVAMRLTDDQIKAVAEYVSTVN